MPFTALKNRKVMLVNMIYTRKPSKEIDPRGKDCLTVIYRDMITNKKEIMNIFEPEFEFFAVQPEYRTFIKPQHNAPYSMLYPIKCKYRNVVKEIAKVANIPNIMERPYEERRMLYKYPYTFGADIDIVTYYMSLWNEQVGNNDIKNPTKCYIDIEVDQYFWDGPMAKDGECEINAITITDNEEGVVHTLLLDNGQNPLIKEFTDNISSFYDELHENFDETFGITKYNIYSPFKDEKEMLLEFGKLIRSLDKDIALIWNASFDIKYIIARAIVLGINPVLIFCDSRIPNPFYYYREDHTAFDFAEKKDKFECSSTTVWLDQLILYAALRKSKGSVKRVNLGAVSKEVLQDDKLDYSDEGNIKTLPYTNYKLFVMYNIKDTLLQKGIENKMNDMQNLYLISSQNNVSYHNATKQTVVFRGFMYDYCRKCKIALGNNTNFDATSKSKKNGSDDDESFEGAINGDPLLNVANGLPLFGNPSKFLYGYTIDFDFSAMYPNSITTFNIFSTTMIGKLIIDKKEVPMENPYDDDYGKQYIEDLIAGDCGFIGEKWHRLSSFDKLCEKAEAMLNIN